MFFSNAGCALAPRALMPNLGAVSRFFNCDIYIYIYIYGVWS